MTPTVLRDLIALTDVRAAEPTIPAGTPWWLAVLLIVVPVISTWVVARGPVWLEKVKQHGPKPVDAPATPTPAAPAAPAGAPVAQRADAALDLLEQSIRDAWKARDQAIRRADRLQAELDAEQDKNAEHAVTIAQLRAEITAKRERRAR